MKLTEYLDKRGMTQVAFADLAGLSITAVNRTVNEKREPSRRVATRIVEATGGEVTYADLWQEAAA